MHPERTVVWQLPTRPKGDLAWTAWSRPDFVENSGQGHWNLMRDLAHGNRFEATSMDSYLARYRFIPYPRPAGYVQRQPPMRELVEPWRSQRSAREPSPAR
jgi:hypothetical protein